MADLSPISWSDLVRRLSILNPHRKDISIDLLARILKRANISRDEWVKIS